MNPEELDLALEDLEVRLERLRALYEQYFLGFEKIEPQVARKEVDRRIYVMRREKIRNTGKRFKFQTLVQRYNTFQQYWQRI
jgi:carbamoylphosphate synthase large subunit